MIPLVEPVFDGNEARYLKECIESGYVSSVGPFVERFEREFAATVGAKHAVACTSGTAALHVALRLAGAGPGRLVAVSDFTFIASANAVSYTGADLLLVDSEHDTWNMNTELLHDEVVRRARAGRRIPDIVELVHVLGHPAAIQPLLELRDRFDIKIVEDAAESLGASWRWAELTDRQVGTVGDLGCFSFNGNKVITCGSGGMIVTEDGELATKARHLTSQAKVKGYNYIHDTIGYNYRLTNIAAALGLAQVERIDKMVRAKRMIGRRYATWLSDLPVSLAPQERWANPSHWLYSVLLNEDTIGPEETLKSMADYGIEARRLWPPLHSQAPYAATRHLGGETASKVYRRGLSLPSSVHLTASDQRAVVEALTTILT